VNTSGFYMPFGVELRNDGVRFARWAPKDVEVRLVLDGARSEVLLPRQNDGWREPLVDCVSSASEKPKGTRGTR